jgi:hypothetical protein
LGLLCSSTVDRERGRTIGDSPTFNRRPQVQPEGPKEVVPLLLVDWSDVDPRQPPTLGAAGEPVAAGAGLVLLPDERSVNAIAEHTHTLLAHHADAGYRDAARAIAEEIARMPSPDRVARRLPEYAARV